MCVQMRGCVVLFRVCDFVTKRKTNVANSVWCEQAGGSVVVSLIKAIFHFVFGVVCGLR